MKKNVFFRMWLTLGVLEAMLLSSLLLFAPYMHKNNALLWILLISQYPGIVATAIVEPSNQNLAPWKHLLLSWTPVFVVQIAIAGVASMIIALAVTVYSRIREKALRV